MFFHSINFKLKIFSVGLFATVLSQYGIPEIRDTAKTFAMWSGLSLCAMNLVQLGQDERLKMKVHFPQLFSKSATLTSKLNVKGLALPKQLSVKDSTLRKLPTPPEGIKPTPILSAVELVDAELTRQFSVNSIVVCKKISAPRGVNDAKPYMVYSVYRYPDNFKNLSEQFCYKSSIPSDDGLFGEMLDLFSKPTKVFKGESLRDVIAAKKKSNVKVLNRA